MPIVVSNEGWVKVPQKRSARPAKPVNPVNVLRGPLAYITGRPEFKEPVRKSSIKQLMLEAATIPGPPPPPMPVIIDERPEPVSRSARSSRTRTGIPSETAMVRSVKQKAPTEILEEADEEIIRPELHPEDSQSRRSASPAASRHSRAAPSTRSRRHVSASQSVHGDDQNHSHRHSRSQRHASSSHSVYSEDRHDDYGHRHRSGRSERSYKDHSYRDRSSERDRHYPHYMARPHHYPHSYTSLPPAVPPIVIYSSPAPAAGCGGHHHSCHTSHYDHGCYTSQPRPTMGIAAPMPQLTSSTAPAVIPAALPEPKPAPSEISSISTGSTRSKAMSYKWYTATQPLIM